MEARWKAVASALLTLLLATALLTASPRTYAGTPEGISFLLANQAADGGFREPGRGESGQDATTAWCVMALAAAGRDPMEVRKNGRSPLDFLATQSGNWRSVTDYERTLLAVSAAGGDPRSFGGVDLLERVRHFEGAGGNIGDAVNSNAFGMLAYKAAGAVIPAGAVQWHRGAQNPDGGWGNSKGSASNPDMTAASVMALRAAGVDAGDPAIASALSYLHSIQNPDGGFSFQPGASDTAATSWCVQAIIAAGQDPGGGEWSRGGNTPLSFVRSMQAADGRFAWMQGREMNPVWTTSYAVCALAGKPFPVISPQRPSPPADGGKEDTGGAGGGQKETGEKNGEAAKEENDRGQEDGPAAGEAVQEGEAEREEAARALGEAESLEEKGEAYAVEAEGGGGGGMVAALLIAAAAVVILLPFSWWLYRRLRSRVEKAA